LVTRPAAAHGQKQQHQVHAGVFRLVAQRGDLSGGMVLQDVKFVLRQFGKGHAARQGPLGVERLVVGVVKGVLEHLDGIGADCGVVEAGQVSGGDLLAEG
jgi:hypothetical protein